MSKIYNALKAKLAMQKEAAAPRVGIFWVYMGPIIEFSDETRSIPAVGGYITSPKDHASFWSQVQRLHPELRDKDYTDVPRGRVNYAANGVYTILLSSATVGNRILVQRIARQFSLPFGKYVAQADMHYNPPPADLDDIGD